jgi:hypothetical protein
MEQIYKKYNRPGAQRLLLLAKSEGLQVSSNDVKEFLASRTEEQQLKKPETQNKAMSI